MTDQLSVTVDGKKRTVTSDPSTPLLYVLRDELGLKSPHFGCGLAQCGACMVQLDGKPVKSCVTPLSAVKDQAVLTLAGLGTPEHPHPIQAAYIAEQTPQCGYCISGWMMTAAAFLKENPKPTEPQIREALKGLKCRCGTHLSIIRAVKRAAGLTTA
jgi:aerobic-type carbon monoxide dehydrogenase small subunit (CoxS/CutS family)